MSFDSCLNRSNIPGVFPPPPFLPSASSAELAISFPLRLPTRAFLRFLLKRQRFTRRVPERRAFPLLELENLEDDVHGFNLRAEAGHTARVADQ